MSPADTDRVFGRGRLKMVTGEHVEVFREQALPGERRRYTKRFLSTTEGDFRHWTEREWHILARLVGHRIGRCPTWCSSTAARPTGRPSCRPMTPASPSITGPRSCRWNAMGTR